MLQHIVRLTLASALILMVVVADGAQDPPKRTGTIGGTVKSQKDSKDGKNTFIEVLAPGEEKARSYHVVYDPKIKAPIEKVLAAVRAAKVGDLVELDWVETGHGPAIKSFQVSKKAPQK